MQSSFKIPDVLFSATAADNPTKDAVLMETTRAIFGNTPTGYLDGNDGGSGDSGVKVWEVFKSMTKNSPKGD